MTRFRCAVALMFVSLALAGCEKENNAPVCGIVKVAKDCKAKCSRLIEAPGAPIQVCVSQLISRKTAENSILKNEIKKVRTIKLPGEVCFEVNGDRPKADSVTQQLLRACKVK